MTAEEEVKRLKEYIAKNEATAEAILKKERKELWRFFVEVEQFIDAEYSEAKDMLKDKNCKDVGFNRGVFSVCSRIKLICDEHRNANDKLPVKFN